MPNNNLDKAIAKYQVSINKNNSESEVLWSRYSAILVFNTILITSIGLSYQDNVTLPYSIRIFLPSVGLITCILWGFMTYRGFRWMEHWIDSARMLEEKYLKDNNPDLNPVLKGNENKEKDKRFLNAEKASYVLIILTGLIYTLFLFHSFYSQPHRRQEKITHFYYNYNDRMDRDQGFPN